MKTLTIETETNNITLHVSAKDAEAVSGAQRFSNEAGLAKLAANWPSSRLVEIWNSLPGVTPVKKFTDRKKAVTRIWKAIQSLDRAKEELPEDPLPVVATPVAPQTPDVAPKKCSVKTNPKPTKMTQATATADSGPRRESKTPLVLRGTVTKMEWINPHAWIHVDVKDQEGKVTS